MIVLRKLNQVYVTNEEQEDSSMILPGTDSLSLLKLIPTSNLIKGKAVYR